MTYELSVADPSPSVILSSPSTVRRGRRAKKLATFSERVEGFTKDDVLALLTGSTLGNLFQTSWC